MPPASRATRRPGWARNPYPLADAALGTAIDWFKLELARRLSPELAAALRIHRPDVLVRASTREDPVPSVLHLFDRVPGAMAGFASVAQALEAVVRRYPVAQGVLTAFSDPEGQRLLHRIVPLLVPIRASQGHVAEPPGERPFTAQAVPPLQITWQALGANDQLLRPDAGGADFRDPMQGVIGDCFLIAAVIAIAWTYPMRWQQRIAQAAAGGDNRYRFGFHPDAPPRALQPQEVTALLPFADGAVPYTTSSDARETWPTFLEKAYLKWLEPTIRGEPTAADYLRLDQRSYPHAACAHLLRLQYDGVTNNMTFDGGVGLTVAEIKARCAARPLPHAVPYRSHVSTMPLTAWTYDGDDARYPQAVADFTVESQLVADHAYAVLGWCEEPATGRAWIMLRNPWGRAPARDTYFTGSPGLDGTPVWLTGRADPGLASVALNTLGVFGVPVDTFTRCFKAVAWSPPG